MTTTQTFKTHWDPQQVIAALAATGSSDPDVLYARKQELLSQANHGSAAALLQIAGGVAASLTILGAFSGVRAVQRGLASRKRIAGNLQTVEAAYCAYMNSKSR